MLVKTTLWKYTKVIVRTTLNLILWCIEWITGLLGLAIAWAGLQGFVIICGIDDLIFPGALRYEQKPIKRTLFWWVRTPIMTTIFCIGWICFAVPASALFFATILVAEKRKPELLTCI